MDRLTKQIIKCKVMQYPRMRIKIADKIADVCEKCASGGMTGGKSSVMTTNGFDEKLALIMSKNDYLWCEAIEMTVKYYNEHGQSDVVKAVEELYWKNGFNADGVALRLCISRKHVYNYVNSFYETLHKFALKNGATEDI